MCLAQGPQRSDAGEAQPSASRSQVKHSATEPLRSLTLTLKAARKKMHLKMSSAPNNCLALLMNFKSIEANSVDPEQAAPMIWVHTVCHRGFLNISADKKGRRLLLRLAH